MNNLTNLRGQFAAVLTRDEMKNVVGGSMPLEGRCVFLRTHSGMESCWYSTDDAEALFRRVYPDQGGFYQEDVNCETNNCTMN